MLIKCRDFYETEDGFMSSSININEIDFSQRKLVVKAHEKEIYTLMDNYILAVIHRDNDGTYNFSKVDFLTHKLQEIIFPQFVPKIHFAFFEEVDTPSYVLERVGLDKLHIAHNVSRQKHHQDSGMAYYYDPEFLTLDENDDINALSKEHVDKIEVMQNKYMYLIDKYGIAFDHSSVNITWDVNGDPISLEVHKARRDYLFNYENCKYYFESLDDKDLRKQDG
jgi:hypothetical protein